MAKIPHARQIFIKPGLAVLLVLLLLSVYAAVPVFHWPASPATGSTAATIPCDSPDEAYCTILRRVVNGATTGDFSQLLTAQLPQPVPCGQQADSHCATDDTATIKLYKIINNRQAVTLTHNEYIDFFRALVGAAGPLRYTGTDCKKVCNATFFAGKVHVLLPLKHMPGGWYLAVPIIRAS